MLGQVATLGRYKGIADVLGIRLRGFPGWFVTRTYHLFQLPLLSRKLRVVVEGERLRAAHLEASLRDSLPCVLDESLRRIDSGDDTPSRSSVHSSVTVNEIGPAGAAPATILVTSSEVTSKSGSVGREGSHRTPK